ncbi:MAG: MOSC domain-containing protein [Deltaproteobacteria bacterium]|nr:MOSC domain-containing protein [Deltaproteobacteria bacterium]|tara:strand:- start:8018 stop:8584 length:567 start_codon:yes stop_codon:yes gene_type:complete
MHRPFHQNKATLEAGLPEIEAAPKGKGTLDWLVARPETGARVILEEAHLELRDGLVGDNWKARGSSKTEDGGPHPELQITLTNIRATKLIAQTQERWALMGDQLYVDLSLSEADLPVGSRLAIGEEAIVEITPYPHNGCKKYAERFGVEAVKFVNSPKGKALHLRGVNARVIQAGIIRRGDTVTKLSP